MQRTANVLVLMGGPDAEREVSVMSGREVATALRKTRRFTVVEQVIGRPSVQDIASLAATAQADVIFPVLHGPWGEGGPLQEMLESLGIPYVGSGPEPSSLAMDKLATKALLARDVPTPQSQPLRRGDACHIELPFVLKPVDDGSSVDMYICRSREEANRRLCDLFERRAIVMAERYVAGREITAGILFGEVLPLIEIVPGVEFYDYDAKYARDDTQYVVAPSLPQGLDEQIRRLAMWAFNRVGCRDLARVDFMVDERGPWFLELNTMPGFTTHSLVPMAAAAMGRNVPDLCAALVEAALDRAGSAPARMSA
jgi:D-alanine-D-alanine ligase